MAVLTDQACTYKVLSTSGAFVTNLYGVLNEPKVSARLNGGADALQLVLDHYPSELSWGQIVRMDLPNGTEFGRWKVEEKNTKWDAEKKGYVLNLVPMVAELNDTKDWIANYTTDSSQKGTPVGAKDPAQFCTDALGNTLHLIARSIVNQGTAQAYAFANVALQQAFDQYVQYGGASYWWWCSHSGYCDAMSGFRNTYTLTEGQDVILGELQEDLHGTINAQTVEGATPPSTSPGGSSAPLSATAVDTNPSNALSIPNIGRRTGEVYRDSSLLDQASVNTMAINLLAAGERVQMQRQVTLIGYTGARILPGDGIRLRISSPDPADGSEAYSTLGPYLVTEVTETPGLQHVELLLKDIVSDPIQQALYNRSLSLLKLITNPSQGFTSSTPIKPSQLTNIPNVPTGLGGTSYIEQSAQVENAAINLTWTASATDSTHDPAASYFVRYCKSGTGNWMQLPATGGTGLVVDGLQQGQGYDFQVAGANAAGVSAWTATTTITTATAAAPAAPSGISAVAGITTAEVLYNLINATDIQFYELWRFTGASTAASPPAGAAQVAQALVGVFTDTGLTANTTYTYWVRAKNWSNQYSPWSSYVQVTTRYVQNQDIAANSIVVDKLATGTMTAGVVISGYIQTAATVDATHSGVRMDGTSIKVYDGSGTNYGAPSGAGVIAELNPAGLWLGPGGTVHGTRVEGSLFISTGATPPAYTAPSTGFSMEGTNGLRFFYLGSNTLTISPQGQITINANIAGGGLTVYGGTINGTAIVGGTVSGASLYSPNTSVGGASSADYGIIISGQTISVYANGVGNGAIVYYTWNGSSWVQAGYFYATSSGISLVGIKAISSPSGANTLTGDPGLGNWLANGMNFSNDIYSGNTGGSFRRSCGVWENNSSGSGNVADWVPFPVAVYSSVSSVTLTTYNTSGTGTPATDNLRKSGFRYYCAVTAAGQVWSAADYSASLF